MSQSQTKSVLVTGANGFIGNAVARAFVRAGWTTYGLIRKSHLVPSLTATEIIPIVGSPADLSFLPKLFSQTKKFDVIVSATEQTLDYIPHYKDIITLLSSIAETSNAVGVRPLVLFTSGCKDYGTTPLATNSNLAPHTESSPLNPPPVLANRAEYAVKIFTHTNLFDAVLLRPTTLYGYGSSYYGSFFTLASSASKADEALELSASPDSILHGTHVDDVAEAYVAIAQHPSRQTVIGQIYNISGHSYETLSTVAEALVQEYGIKGGVKWVPEPAERKDLVQYLIGFSQWVGSEKLRTEIGWRDRRPLFSEGLHVFRGAYEAACEGGDEGVERVKTLARRVKEGM